MRALFRFVRLSRFQELDPVLDAIFGKDEHNAFELLVGDRMSLRLIPEMRLEYLRIITVVVTVGPYHQCRMATSGKAILEFLWHLLDQLFATSTWN